MDKMKFELVEEDKISIDSMDTIIKVAGVGGCGCNIINDMCRMDMRDVELVAINTDAQSLNKIESHEKIQIGKSLTRGFGTGSDPLKAQKAAEEDKNVIENKLRGADMLVLVAGLGGGTGSGASPVVADIARSMDILTAAFLITPFNYELNGEKSRIVREAYASLKDKVDMIVAISNEKIKDFFPADKQMEEAYKEVNKVLIDIMRGLVKMISKTGTQNIDFADVKKAMQGKGNSFMGVGRASGTDRAKAAFENAINNPFTGNPNLSDANYIVINFFGNITMGDTSAIEELKAKYTGASAMVKFGSTPVPSMGDELEVTMVISGLREEGLSSEFAPASSPYIQDPALAAKPDGDAGSKTEQVTPEARSESEILEAIGRTVPSLMDGNYENPGIEVPAWQRYVPGRRTLPKLN